MILNEKTKEQAGMSILVLKTKVQHVRKKLHVSQITEED